MHKKSKEIDIVAIVPARAGSKRLPRKNVLPLGNKPLIQWTLDAAKASGVIDLIVVTSDDTEVLSIAEKSAVKTIVRPEHLATDTSTTIDVILHTLEALRSENIYPKRVMLLQPTSPLRTAEDIKSAVKKMELTNAASVISVCATEHSPLWCNTLDDNGCMDNFLPPEIINKRSQDLPTYYRLNGAIYLIFTEKLIAKKSFFTINSFAFVMDREHSVDIDNIFDFNFAKQLILSNSSQAI